MKGISKSFTGSVNPGQLESCCCSMCVPDSGDNFVNLLKGYRDITAQAQEKRKKVRTIELPDLARKCFRDELYRIAEVYRSKNFKGAKLIGFCELNTPVIEKVLSELEFISKDDDLTFIDNWEIRQDILLLIFDFFRDIDINEDFYRNMKSITDSKESDIDLNLDLRYFLHDGNETNSEDESDHFYDDLFDADEGIIEDIENLMI